MRQLATEVVLQDIRCQAANNELANNQNCNEHSKRLSSLFQRPRHQRRQCIHQCARLDVDRRQRRPVSRLGRKHLLSKFDRRDQPASVTPDVSNSKLPGKAGGSVGKRTGLQTHSKTCQNEGTHVFGR